MKKFREIIAIKEGREDTNYFLVRTAEGDVFVETLYFPNEPFVKGSQGRDDFT